jgi:hypothetical protein
VPTDSPNSMTKSRSASTPGTNLTPFVPKSLPPSACTSARYRANEIKNIRKAEKILRITIIIGKIRFRALRGSDKFFSDETMVCGHG